MTDHDPLCFCDEFGVCICKELERRDARVRADERERIVAELDGPAQESEAMYAHAEAVAARMVEVIVEMQAEWTEVREIADMWARESAEWERLAVAERGKVTALRAQIDGVAELLHRQRVQHAALIAPTHPTAPVLIEVDRVLTLIGGSE